MGENYEEAKEILSICKKKNIKAAVNFQLPFAPVMIAAKDMIYKGLLGEIYDLEMYVNVFYSMASLGFPILKLERVEIFISQHPLCRPNQDLRRKP